MVTSTTEYYYYESDYVPMTTEVQVPSAIGLTILILLGIIGNLMTIAAYFADNRLNSVYDFFIFNLALTDLLLSCISMPFYAVYTLMEFTWPFGYAFCKIYLTIDFTLCFESILIMLILSLDRLLMISIGPVYLQKCTKRVAAIEIGISWVISFLVYGPAIIGWNHWKGYSIVEPEDCDVEFAYDVTFTTATAFVEFILPFVCLTLINAFIYFKIRKRMKVKPAVVAVKPAIVSTPGNVDKSAMDPHTESGKKVDDGVQAAGDPASTDTSQSNEKSQPKLSDTQKGKQDAHSKTRGHVKAARFLAMLVIAFLVFWAPYTITTVVIALCEECVNLSLYEFFNWLLWMKSAINPFLYAYNSPRYRKQFEKYLTLNGRLCKKKKKEVEPHTIVTSTH